MNSDYLIIGGGIMGLAVARSLRARHKDASITLIEKESGVAHHASGRNSGVLHAGFYYAADSLKAKFCRDGNKALRAYVAEHKLRINDCGKIVVAKNEKELEALRELYRRGQANGVTLKLIDEKDLAAIEPNARTAGQAIYSPTTAVVDPIEVCNTLKREMETHGVSILTGTAYEYRFGDNGIVAGGQRFEAGMIINCAGLYADRIARDFGFCRDYGIIPFKGVYLKYEGADTPAKPCIYPVPNLRNPFLGVHFSVTVDGTVKIGPTAIPAFWRENYRGVNGFSPRDMVEILGREAMMFALNADFRSLAMSEMKKYSKHYMAQQAALMVKHLDAKRFSTWMRPGIRAQLFDKRTLKLLHDFVVEGDAKSVHVLNAVSPAFTSSFPFAEWIVSRFAPDAR
ncbi:MAG: L-2-hydroxyglutarate oxidase [Pseudomonadota bacterium]|nr:L-2-hydroxyglutarate oxidase [Pseudomonadota bacterium]MDE3037547.1 L-2-hydroxyglutarate oxidase [Pseudomonadota bacterium]